jgi:O-antigen ligase
VHDAPNGENSFTMTSWILLAMFVMSLQQFSVYIGGSGVSANYVYVLLPFLCWFGIIQRRVVRRREVLDILAVYTLIYVLGIPGDFQELRTYVDSPIRRFGSYVVFVFPLILALVEFKPKDGQLFKKAVILASVLYSVRSVMALASVVGTLGLFALKGALGSQRYGFVLCFGFFIALFSEEVLIRRWVVAQRVVICSIILIGLVLTFSRASLVALAGGFAFLALTSAYHWLRGGRRRSNGGVTRSRIRPAYVLAVLVPIVAAFFMLQAYFNVDLLEFYGTRFGDLATAQAVQTALSNTNSSEGYRLYLFTKIMEFVAAHPLIGSSYRGIYLLFDEFRDAGSAHNQYTDIFLRTGLIGTLLWCLVVYKILRYCSHDRALQIGLVAILIYGSAHETFKESQGSFIFGMLLSLSYGASLLRRRERAFAADVPA